VESPVAPRSDRLQLALELSPRAQPVELEPTFVHCCLNGTSRLVQVSAVAEAALCRQRLDVLERRAEVTFPELQLPKARRVDHERAPR
jgi:hypothetical protein